MKSRFLGIFIIIILILCGCNPRKTPPIDEVYYTVNFYDYEGKVIKTEKVKKFSNATPPILLEKEGYVFIKWDHDFDSITDNLDIKPIYEKVPVEEFTVKFYADGLLLSTQKVLKGQNAIEPTHPVKESNVFKGWDQDFTNVQKNLQVNAIFEVINYFSYIANFSYPIINPISQIINRIPIEKPFKTISNIYEGGFRRENQVHYYNENNCRPRNTFGFEVAINNEGVVIDKSTLVEMPKGGFILSGHNLTAKFLEDNVNIGDLIFYNNFDKTASIYRDNLTSPIIRLNIEIMAALDKISEAFDTYKALDYKLLNQKINQLVEIYNSLTTSYDDSFALCDKLLLDIDFLLVETKPIQTNAVWHYPLRSGNFYERNLSEVKSLLDQYEKIGINKIYLNTNFNGKSIYRSEYLSQSLSGNYTYEGYKDYLECFFEEAHKRNISVVAWTNTLIAGDGMNNKFYSDRGWILKGYNGEDNFNGMYYVDISNPDVQDFLKNVFYELASNYNLDGIEFDFIRYPNSNLYSYDPQKTKSISDSGYTESFINSFKEKYNFIGDLKSSLLQNDTLRYNWLTFKEELLTQFVMELTSTIKIAKPNISISAAVMPNINTARNVYLQDWECWIDKGWIDTLEPMIYSGDTNYVIDTLNKMYQLVNGRANIVVGIFPEGSGASIGTNAEQIDSILANFIVGWSKFSSKTIFNHSYMKESISLMKREYTAQVFDSKEKIYQAYIIDLKEKTNGYYKYISEDFGQLEMILNDDKIKNNNYYETLSLIENYITKISNNIIKERLLQTHTFVSDLIFNDKSL